MSFLNILPALILTIQILGLSTANSAEKVGDTFRFDANNLAMPYATDSVARTVRMVASSSIGKLRLPKGFKVKPFYQGLSHARWLLALENGDILVAESRAGKITLLRDADGDGRAEKKITILSDLDRPHGMAYRAGWLYFAEPRLVRRVSYDMDLAKISGPVQNMTADGALGDGRGHWTRNIIFSKDGSKLLIAIGSRSNISEEPNPRASVQELDLKTGKLDTVASGLRNPVGIERHPETGDVYVVVNERDGYGDQLVPDYFTRIQKGDFFGWPWAYSGKIADPEYGVRRPDMVVRSKTPDVLIQSHSAPLGLVFYTGASCPDEYRNDAFIALHGSWNSSDPTGYKLIRVRFINGRPEPGYENFALGFRVGGTDRARVWGRPVGLAVARDGALLVADDVSQSIWRINYE